MPNEVADRMEAMGKSNVTDQAFLLSIDRASLIPISAVTERLETDISAGLSQEEAVKRLERFGSNELTKRKRINPLRLFATQFASTVVILLVVAAALSAIGKEYFQAAGIVLAVLINAIVGFITEYKAQISLAALEKLSGPTARLRRGGKDQEVPATDIVPGDIVILEEGSRIPADLRLVTAAALSVDESMLSGESMPVYKSSNVEDVSDHSTVAYQGTLILKGRAKGIVIATGCNTKLGELGCSLTDIVTKSTPLQDDLEKLGKQLSLLTIFVCSAVFLLGVLHGESMWEMIQSSIALAVAAIPEGLPVVATLALASGTNRMVKLGAIIRKLSAVETLGCTEIICTDKTGTLTQNQMMVTDIVVDGKHISVTGNGYAPEGELRENDLIVSVENCLILQPLLTSAVLCNDAKLEFHDNSDWHIHGDPTEGALLTLALKAGLDQHKSKDKLPRQKEFAFDLNRKRMTTIHSSENKSFFAYTKGAPETVLSLCHSYAVENGHAVLSEDKRKWFLEQNAQLASQGLRVLGFASRKLSTDRLEQHSDAECEMTFLGLIGMSDRPKVGVRKAIQECKQAGIQIMMLTGDQTATAMSIAHDLNILPPESTNSDVLTGKALAEMDAKQLEAALVSCAVIARVKPEDKLSIVKALQSAGKVVAMTGDGINDAPALQQSDIGVAMGKSGTSLARESSDMVITDDNFSTIVNAVEQGRVIYANISCAVAYLLTASLSSVFAVLLAVIFDLGLPLSPLQLLWLNLIMHIFPALGLVLQEARPGIMNDPPRGRKQSLLGKDEYIQIVLRAIIVSGMTMIAVSQLHGATVDLTRTVVLCIISLSLLLQSWSWLALKRPADDMSYFGSRPMLLNTTCGVILLLVALFFAPVQAILCTVPLSAENWSFVLFYSLGTYLLTSMLRW
jgi:P-type Ca2+ transporter type 2C